MKLLRELLDKTYRQICYVDLDGVMCDFDGYLKEKLGHTFKGDAKDWAAAAQFQDIYAELKPYPGALQLFRQIEEICAKHGTEVQILTGVPSEAQFPKAEADKREWVYKHLSQSVKFNIGPHGSDKWKWAKAGFILIDDMEPNVKSWVKAGGVGILYKNAEQTIKELRAALGEHA